ncbi:MAG: hypothetical protein IJI68_11470 [Eggerthellaceae bacterium]|nr:hypothetical protein [Eggerthellaceae bacterium]
MRNGALIGLTVYYDTPDPRSTGCYAAYYRVHWRGPKPDWGKWKYNDDDRDLALRKVIEEDLGWSTATVRRWVDKSSKFDRKGMPGVGKAIVVSRSGGDDS